MFTNYIVNQISVESTTIKSFYLTPADGLPIPCFIPGQYVNVKLKIAGEDRELIRSYTLSDRPGKDYLRITVKQEPEGKISGYFYNQVAVGDTIALSPPVGNFNLNINHTTPVVMLSGGVGITPMLSMAEYLQAHQPEREVHFIHSSKNKYVQPMHARLQQIKAACSNFNLSVLHSSPVYDELLDTDYHLKGRITKELIPTIDKGTNYYVCGPDEYIKNVRSYLSELGVPDNQVFFEYFGAAVKEEHQPEENKHTAQGLKITLTKSDRELIWGEGKGTILELCESEGLTPPNSCRMGTCSTCESRLIKGTFEYDPEPFMEPEGDNIFICCAIPTSDMEIEL